MARAKRQDASVRRRRRASPRAKKSLGQHFLHDQGVVCKIADALEVSNTDTVVEVGAGTGILTAELAARARRVVAVELDDRLAGQLQDRFEGTNVEVVHGDALDIDPHTLIAKGESYALAGNLPYNVAQLLLRRRRYGHAWPFGY